MKAITGTKAARPGGGARTGTAARGMWAMAGLALYLVVDVVTLYSSAGLALGPCEDGASRTCWLVATLAARIAALAAAFLATRRKRVAPVATPVLAGMCAALSVAGLLLSNFAGSTALACTGGALTGAGQATALVAFLSRLPLLSHRASYVCVLLCHAGATALVALASLFAPTGPLALAVACALCGAALLALCPQVPQAQSDAWSQAHALADPLFKNVAYLALFAFISGFVWFCSGTAETSSPAVRNFTLGASALVIVVMLVPALALRRPLDVEEGFGLALPASALGFLVLPGLIPGVDTAAAGILANTGFMVTGVILYGTAAETVRASSTYAVPVYAACDLAGNALLLVGMGFGRAVLGGGAADGVRMTAVGLGCLYVLVALASWALGRRRHDGADHADIAQADAPVATDEAAREHGLSEQQGQVLGLIAAGNTVQRTAELLNLSPSAVKYHVQKIYRAFDVHTRAELQEALGRGRGCAGQARPELEGLARQRGLSAREAETLALLLEGRSLAEISERLGVSENTAKTYVKRVYAKLGVHSRQEALDLAGGEGA